ncbi:MAG: hypothetical protein IKG22_07870 [Atopobiaceae bacterium]|nr:hypothetical protein [Atopobiaceae bacterium]
MSGKYPQETAGTTLLEEHAVDEQRRVFMRWRMNRLEIGELTSGDLTEGIYGVHAHLHCIHLDAAAQQYCAERLEAECHMTGEEAVRAFLVSYFENSNNTLADLMDDFDYWGVKYGYLNVQDGGHIRYRPAYQACFVGYAG